MTRSRSRSNVLCFGHDASLLSTRKWLMEDVGLTVVDAVDLKQFRDCVRSEWIDLVLLCQTLDDDEREAAAKFLENYAPRARCLVMFTKNVRCPSNRNLAVIDAASGPAQLLQEVGRLTSVLG